jgi:integrase
LATDISAKTVRNILALLNKIFVDSKKHHYVKFNPMTDVDKPKADKKKKGRALKPDEVNAILVQCDARLRPIFLTALLTGMRRGEIFGLRWSDVDWEGNVINVRQALFCRYGKYQPRAEGEPWYSFVTPKSDESIREIDLSPALRKELLELYMKGPKTELVFCTESGTPLDPDNLTKREFAQAVDVAGVGKVRFHDLRHTFGAMKLEQGENIYYVQRQMGHSSIQVTIDIYGHLLETRKPAAAAKTDHMIFGTSGQPN